jgi:general secretion pathway protein N
MRLPTLAALGIAAYGVFLAATLPASLAAREVQARLGGRVELREATGTLWNGAARASIATPGGRVEFDRLAWRLRPARLLTGRIAVEVAATGPGIEARFEAARGLSRWEVNDLAARGTAAAAIAALPWIAAWHPEGEVVASSAALTSDGRDLLGSARVEWRGASVGLSEVRPLGDYRAEIVAEGANARIAVSTLEGALQLAGEGTLTLPTRLAFTGEARARGPRAAELGPRRPDGARTLAWRTR